MTAQVTQQRIHPQTTRPTTVADRRRLSEVCHRIRLAVREMNDASRRVVEVQAPWAVDSQWYRG